MFEGSPISPSVIKLVDTYYILLRTVVVHQCSAVQGTHPFSFLAVRTNQEQTQPWMVHSHHESNERMTLALQHLSTLTKRSRVRSFPSVAQLSIHGFFSTRTRNSLSSSDHHHLWDHVRKRSLRAQKPWAVNFQEKTSNSNCVFWAQEPFSYL